MKKSIISAIAVAAIFSVCPLLQSCSDTSSRTTYTTSDPGYGYSSGETTTYTTSNEPAYRYAPSETTTTTTYRNDDHDSVVGATADAAGTIIEAPFRIVGDTLGVIF